MSETPKNSSTLRGRSVKLSLPRRVVCDLLHFAQQIPTVPVQRVIDVSALMGPRKAATVRVSWPAIFAKAYSILCRQTPEFRRAYIEYPWSRLYEHPIPIASIAIEREYKGETGVFFAYFPEPDGLSLGDLEAAITNQRTGPVEVLFASTFWIYRLPRFFRRFLWWYMLNVRGARKAQFVGTFGISVYSSLGAESLHPLSPLTSTLNYGVIDEQGRVPTRIVYDHRVMDGSTVARALVRLEEILNGEILQELRSMGAPSRAREAA